MSLWGIIEYNVVFLSCIGSITSVLNSAIMVRGTYRSSSKKLVTKAEEISFDFGETWQKNDGSLILKSESDSELISIDEGKISLAGVEYVKF